MPTQEELKQQLLQNIREIQKVIPEFTMTQEQIDGMITPQKIADHERAKNYLNQQNKLAEANKSKLLEYVPTNAVPAAFRRNYFFVIKSDGSPESEEFNRTMFEGMIRDDEVGDVKRANYVLYCLNATKNVDRSIMRPGQTESAMLDYVISHSTELNIAQETEHFLKENHELKLTDQAKAEILAGKTIGELLKGVPLYLADEMSLTFPAAYLTADQKIKLQMGAKIMKIPGGPGNVSKILNEYAFVEGISTDPVASKIDPESKPAADLTMRDLVYTIPQEERFMGGYSARMAVVKQNLPEIVRISGASKDELMKKIHGNAEQMLQTMGQVQDPPTPEEQKMICEQEKKLAQSIHGELWKHKKPEDPLSAGLASLNRLSKGMSFLDDERNLQNLIYYESHAAGKRVEQMDLRGQIDGVLEEQLRTLNDTAELMDSAGDGLTQQNIAELRAQTAEVLRTAGDILEQIPENSSRGDIQMVRTIRNRMQLQLRNLGRATAGMSASDALAGNGRELDITGHTFRRAGNQMSTRIPMRITGSDGKPVSGYFTERTTLDPDKAFRKIRRQLLESWPGRETMVDEAIEFYRKEPPAKDKREFPETLKAKYPEDQEIIEAFNNQTKNLCDSFLDTKASYMAWLGVTGNSDVDTRNIAMSDVADLLGQGDLLARSTPMTVYNDGRPMEGCFMESAEGDDLAHVRDGRAPHFLKADLTLLDHSPALKQISDLQVLDYICGNVDRHSGNLIYQFSEDGKIQKVVGIDNDNSFPEREAAGLRNDRFVHPEDMKVVSESMAEKIRGITPEMLRTTLGGSHLTEPEISRAVERLQEMKTLISQPEPPFRIVPDREFSSFVLTDLANDHNLFHLIQFDFKRNVEQLGAEEKEQLLQKTRPAEAGGDVVDLFRKADKSAVLQDAGPIKDLMNELQDGRRHVFGGSGEYDEVQKAVEGLNRAMGVLAEPERVADEKLLKGLKNSYRKVEQKCAEYLARKQRQNKLNAGGRTGRRIAAVKSTLEFCRNRQASLVRQLGDEERELQEADMRKESEKLMMEGFRADPKAAGRVLKEAVERAEKNPKNAEVQRTAVRKISQVARFMKQANLTMKDLGVSSEERQRAAAVVRRVKENSAVKKNEAPEKKAAAGGPVL